MVAQVGTGRNHLKKVRILFTPPAWYSSQWCCQKTNGNDPSAGSPTETLLRLLLPLNAQVWESSKATVEIKNLERPRPNTSLKRSIGSSDGRCVQRAGT